MIGKQEYIENPHWTFEIPISTIQWQLLEHQHYIDPNEELLTEQQLIKKDEIKETRLNTLRNAYSRLTEKQQKILELYLANNTQNEIAAKLKLKQPDVSKALFGNDAYVDGKFVNTYGGIVKKLKKIIGEQ